MAAVIRITSVWTLSSGSSVRTESDGAVGVVAERQMSRPAAAAERNPFAAADHPALFVLHLDVAAGEERPVSDRHDPRMFLGRLLGTAIEPLVFQRTRGAALDSGGDRVRVSS